MGNSLKRILGVVFGVAAIAAALLIFASSSLGGAASIGLDAAIFQVIR